MICNNCGTENPESGRFCKVCGAPLQRPAEQPAAPMPGQPQPAPQPQTQCAPVYQVQASDSTVTSMQEFRPCSDTIKKFAKSPVFLAAVALTIISLIISIAQSLAETVNAAELINNIIEYLDLGFLEDVEVYRTFIDSVNTAETASVVSVFLSHLPSILVAVGLILIVGASFSKQKKMPVGGLTLVQVIEDIFCAWYILLLVAIEALLGYVVYLLSAEDVQDSMTVMIITMVAVLIVFLFPINFYRMAAVALKKAKMSIDLGRPQYKLSIYVIAVLLLGFLFNLLLAYNAFAEPADESEAITVMILEALNLHGAMIGVQHLLSAAASLCFAIVMIRYRSGMRRCSIDAAVVVNQTSPIYAQNVYVPAQEVKYYPQAGTAPAAPDAAPQDPANAPIPNLDGSEV